MAHARPSTRAFVVERSRVTPSRARARMKRANEARCRAKGSARASATEATPSALDILRALMRELKTVPLREDASEEARALVRALDDAKMREGDEEKSKEDVARRRMEARASAPKLIGAYWNARGKALMESKAVRDAAPLASSVVNVAVAGVVLRLFLPRLAALEAVGGFDELAEFFGLPPRAELSGYLEQLQALPVLGVFAVYFGLFVAEKMTMTDEFLPIGFVLPVISPAVFGGVFGGTVATSLASTMAASVNFFLARYVLKDKILDFKWGESEPVGKQKWFAALSRRFDSSQFPESTVPEGFKSALLLRLCPILPIPISGNWYVCGLTPLKFREFFAAHFIGSSKTAFIDAYLGSILLSAVLDEGSIKEQAQGALVFETVAIVAISILVSTYATELFTQVLDEEGVDAGKLMGFGQQGDSATEEKEKIVDNMATATEEFIAAAAVPVGKAQATPREKTTTPNPKPIASMPADEKALIEAGEALWQRAARMESRRQQMTIEEMTDHEAMNVDM